MERRRLGVFPCQKTTTLLFHGGRMLKSILFDMGGTLEDVYHKSEFNQNCGQKLLEYLSRHGIYLDLGPIELVNHIEAQNKIYREEAGIKEVYPYERWAYRYFNGMNFDSDVLCIIADNLANIWERNYFHRSLRTDAVDMLEKVRDMEISMGVISNTGCLIQVIEILHEYNIHQFFGCIYLSSVSCFRKPHPGIFTAAAYDLCSLPEECIYVGDTISKDVLGARAAGFMASIRINSGLTKDSDSGLVQKNVEADYLVKNLCEIPDILKNIKNAGASI
jgi:putative hydrolase of the HAD superfamily